jgi:hypothetical protein
VSWGQEKQPNHHIIFIPRFFSVSTCLRKCTTNAAQADCLSWDVCVPCGIRERTLPCISVTDGVAWSCQFEGTGVLARRMPEDRLGGTRNGADKVGLRYWVLEPSRGLARNHIIPAAIKKSVKSRPRLRYTWDIMNRMHETIYALPPRAKNDMLSTYHIRTARAA